MAKDPAFLFYSKDWLEGTMEMSAEEKGVYIDLLAHQHQKGSLPAEIKKLSKLAGMSEDIFNKIWIELSSKFIANASGRLVNRRLNGIVSERLDKGWRNTIVGTLGAIVRYGIQNEGKDHRVAEKVKKTFKVDDFLACAKENLSEQVSIWFSDRYDKCYKSIANANTNGNEDGNVLGGLGEEKKLGPEMVEAFKRSFPDYPVDQNLDFSACLEIAYKIANSKNWSRHDVTNGKMPEILNIWLQMIGFIKSDKWFCTRAISDINKEFQRLIQSMKNGTTTRGNNQQNAPVPGIVTEAGTRKF